MYVIRNAWRNLWRAKGRSLLVGIIVLVIAVSSCLALSIREAADTARTESLADMQVTAQITMDRSALMQQARPEENSGGFDKDSFRELMNNAGSLTLDELTTYAAADSVKSFYYTSTLSLNAGDGIEPFSTSTESESTSESTDSPTTPEGGGQHGGFGGMNMSQSDFSLIGASSDSAMTDFLAGTSTITEGTMFDENTDELVCVISDELATYNELTVGKSITLLNPDNDDESYTLKIVGIYHNDAAADAGVQMPGGRGGFGGTTDTANQIYTGAKAIDAITSASATANKAESDDSDSAALTARLSGTYCFSSVEDYEQFEAQAKALGLSDNYTVSSSDLNAFEQSMTPLTNLSNFALTFLIVVLAIGAVILVVLSIFQIRERKYEIGVLTAIGMRKSKVAAQFVTELCSVTMIFILLGTAIGAAVSVPVTNALLSTQLATSASVSEKQEAAMGRPMGGMDDLQQPDAANGQTVQKDNLPQSTADTVKEVSSATDWVVVLELLGIGLLLALVASLVAVVFILRYEPLKILTNRD